MTPDVRARELQRTSRASHDELRDSDRRFRTLFEYGADAIVILDRAGAFRFTNPAARHTFGYPAQGLLGAALLDFVHEDDRDAVATSLRAVSAGSRGYQVELAFRTQTRAGAWRLHDASLRNLLDDADVQGLVLTARSFAAQEDVLEQLYQTQRIEAIARLAGGVAHDYNNILSVITGNTEFLLLDAGLDGETRVALEEIATAAGRAAMLTRQLLAFSRKQMMRPEPVNLAEFVASLEVVIRAELGRGVTLQTDLDTTADDVRADPRQLQTVLLQLATNAREAMLNGGHLRIETDQVEVTSEHAARLAPMPAGTYGRLRVMDTGVGMDPATRARVFEPFFTTKERGKGTGLGLAMVYGIVKQSGGFLWVDSVPGSGSAFTVYLPVATEVSTRREDSERPVEVAQESGERVLVVDDDELVRRMTVRTLKRVGYRVRAAKDANEALRLAREGGAPDLLLSDIVMPGMTGRELATLLLAERPGLRVLMMSGFPDLRSASPALEDDTPFLQKPFTVDDLLAKVRSVLMEPTVPR